jgi:hypothetical protein
MSALAKETCYSARNVFLVGVGILPGLHITPQAVRAIRESNCVVYFSDPQLTELMSALDVDRYEVLDYLYKDGGVDEENYAAIFERVIFLLNEYGSVAFLFQGNPRLGVSLTEMLEASSAELDFNIHVIPGISSFETLIIDAHCDPLERGAVIIDANRWLLYDHVPNISLDYFVYHICSVATQKTNYSDASVENHLEMLQERFLEYYPSEHLCKVIVSTGAGADSADILEVEVCQLFEILPKVSFASTLFIPSVTVPEINLEVLDLIMHK